MATEISTYLAEKLLDHVFGGTPYTAPVTVYASLYTSDPGPADTGTEAAFLNYARQAVTFGAVASRQISNSAKVTYPAAGATGVPETITHAALHDAVSGGNLLVYSPVDASRIVNEGTEVEFDITALVAEFAL